MIDKKLEDVLGAVIEGKTFSLEAVEAIKALRTENQELSVNIETAQRLCRDLNTQAQTFKVAIEKLQSEVDAYKSRENALIKREEFMTQLETQKGMLSEFKGDLYQLLLHLFRSPVRIKEIKETGSTPILKKQGEHYETIESFGNNKTTQIVDKEE
jgi:DNA repair exonuclease SbcCD ATPase subunit